MTVGARGSNITASGWRSLGLVFKPDGRTPWMVSHAANPVAHRLDASLYRVFFASRDAHNRSHIGWFDLDLDDPSVPAAVALRPSLAPGPWGHFDDHGVYAASIVREDDDLVLFYTGWNPGPPPLYYPSVGTARSSDDGATFRRTSAAPLLARTEVDPWMISQPMVLKQGDRWRMWYISGLGWSGEVGALRSRYQIRYGESDDGRVWRRDGTVSIALADDESNICRACVVPTGSGYEAWYAVTSEASGGQYRLGRATSHDGIHFRRQDATAAVPRSGAWDDAAQAYPWAFEARGTRYLLYNGNRNGRDGIGLAIQEDA